MAYFEKNNFLTFTSVIPETKMSSGNSKSTRKTLKIGKIAQYYVHNNISKGQKV